MGVRQIDKRAMFAPGAPSLQSCGLICLTKTFSAQSYTTQEQWVPNIPFPQVKPQPVQ